MLERNNAREKLLQWSSFSCKPVVKVSSAIVAEGVTATEVMKKVVIYPSRTSFYD